MSYQHQRLYVNAPPTSGLATSSLVFGVLGLVFGCCSFGVPSLIAVLLGHMALRETKSGARGGHGMAIAGLILGYVLVLPMIMMSVWIFLGAGMTAIDPR